MKLRSAAALLACAASSACEASYAYIPARGTTTIVGGNLAAQFDVPAEAPHEAPRGHVWIESSGIVDLTPEASDEEIHVLHVRAVIENDTDQEWVFDTREQQIVIDKRGPTAVAFATADAGTQPPQVTAAAGTKRMVDLYFSLPDDLEEDADLPQFDALWRLTTPTRAIAERTSFERVDESTQSYAAGPDYLVGDAYWGPYWYNPYYPRFAFVVIGPRRGIGHGFVFHGGGGHGYYGHGFHGGGFHGGGFHGGGHAGGHGHH